MYNLVKKQLRLEFLKCEKKYWKAEFETYKKYKNEYKENLKNDKRFKDLPKSKLDSYIEEFYNKEIDEFNNKLNSINIEIKDLEKELKIGK